MPDPIRVEEAFQEAAAAIETAQSFRFIFHQFFLFTTLLDGEYSKYQSYIRQLADTLPLYSLPVTWSGLDPGKLQKEAEMLEHISSEIKTDACSEVIRRLMEVSFLQYICVCEPEKAEEQFTNLTGLQFIKGKTGTEPFSPYTNLSDTYKALSELSEQSGMTEASRRTIHRLLDDIRRMLKRDRHSMLIPVVEEIPAGMCLRGQIRYGRLRRIRLTGAGREPGEDILTRNYHVLGAESTSQLDHSSVTSWGRRKAEETHPALKGQFFKASLQYDITQASHKGESGAMAISAMWYTYLLDKAGLRQRYTLAGNTAMTGDVDDNGVVLPVDPEGIESKTEAAFFSWVNVLAVPAQQLREFEGCLKKMNEAYPDRELTLIGVENLDGIFYDRRLSDYVVESRFRHTFKKMKKEKFKTAGLPLIIVLLLIIARMAYGPVDRNPVSAEYYGSQLVLKNISGAVVTGIEVSEATIFYGNSHLHYRSPLVQLFDINNDGINEVFFSNALGRYTTDEPFVRAWSVTGDSLIWEKKIIFEYQFPNQSAYLNTSLKVSEIQILNTSKGSKVAIFADARRYFHSAIFVMNINDGSIEQEFIHPGRIKDLQVVDIDDDSYDEMISIAVNNAYWSTSIAVLEYSEGERGHAPATDGYIPLGLNPADMLHYILIPKTLIATFFEPLSKYNQGENINYDPLTEHFNIGIIEGLSSVHEYEQNIMVYYHFNKNFEPVGLGTSDTFDVAARDFYLEGKIPFEPDYDYFEALQDSIQYWDGEKFVYTNEYFKE
jgi:hypothetical protein